MPGQRVGAPLEGWRTLRIRRSLAIAVPVRRAAEKIPENSLEASPCMESQECTDLSLAHGEVLEVVALRRGTAVETGGPLRGHPHLRRRGQRDRGGDVPAHLCGVEEGLIELRVVLDGHR